jgi:predicted transcriptional regulator
MLRRKKRTKNEIIHDILDQCQTGSRKTWIMYRANLSYVLVTRYLNELEKLGLVESRDGLFYTTEKGKQLLELLKAWKQKKAELDDVTNKIREILPEEKRGRKNQEPSKEQNQAPEQEQVLTAAAN